MQVTTYLDARGREPLTEWVENLRDSKVRSRIKQRIERLALGQWGDYRALGGELYEMRLFFGPGYRVYFASTGSRLVVLLCGGDKSSQARDIEKANMYWCDYKEHCL